MANGQSNAITRIINDIEFKEDTLLSVCQWVAENVKYDVKKLSEISDRRRPQKVYNMTMEELEAEKLNKVIKQKKGVCEDYALLFDAIVSQLGYRSYVVSGMYKNNKGRINKTLGHAWNAVELAGVWKLYDTTWGAGYVSDKNKFVKNYSTDWYDVSPEEMIKTHLPYDPIWQLSTSPINYTHFADNTMNSDVDSEMDYNKLIDLHLTNDGKLVLQNEIERCLTTGKDVKLMIKHRKGLQSRLDVYDLINNPNAIQDAINNFQITGDVYNEYLSKGRNKQFKAKKWSVEYSKATLQSSKQKLDSGIQLISSLDFDSRMMSKNISEAKKLSDLLEKELIFLDKQSQ